MRKLSLNSLNLGAESLLPMGQLKTVFGGNVPYGGICGAYLPSGAGGNDTQFDPPYPSATGGNGQPTIFRGVSQSEALSLTQGVQGAKWCCESCGSASWY